MVIYCLRTLTEYTSIVLFLNKIADKKVKVNSSFLLCLFIDIILLYLSKYNKSFNILVYVFWFIYIGIEITGNFKDAMKPFIVMVISIPVLQMIFYMIFYLIFANFLNYYINTNYSVAIIEIAINIIMCIFVLAWKKRYLYDFGKRLKKFNKFILLFIVTIVLVYILCVFKSNDALKAQLIEPIILCVVIWGLTIILLENAEMEKKRKTEELELYAQYTNVFKDALTVIKMKQHEFDNHINAIKCMQYVIEDREELIKEQQEYCESIIKENKFNKVLLLNVSPILLGYLYSKFTIASGEGIQIVYDICEIKDEERISMNDLIEVIGILFDNAVEELLSKDKRNMRVALYYDDNARFNVDISNESDRLSNTEIEKFFMEGYSTKGENRGIGLYRLNNLVKRYKEDLYVDNVEIDKINFLRFRVIFAKNKKGVH